MKYCPKCKETKSFDLFNKNKKNKDGLQSYCVVCQKEIQAKYRQDNREKVKEYNKRYSKINKEKFDKYYLKYRTKNKETVLKNQSKYKKNNKGKVNARTAARHAAKMQRTPKWLTSDEKWLIQEIYELASLRTKLTGVQWHVDHVVPMQGTTVSGLHCPENLQVIPSIANVSKNNKWCWETQK